MPDEVTMDLGGHAAALFGYGSLLSKASIAKTLGRAYDGPFVVCGVEGWRRSWDVAMPNPGFYADTPGGHLLPERILYLNVRPEPGSLLNGVLFAVGEDELRALDKREWIYDRLAMRRQLRGVRLIGGEAWMYVAKPEFVMASVPSPAVAAVRSSYLRILEAGMGQLPESFRSRFEQTSDPVPRHLVIDDKRT
jgi:cation transport regulator ChaC